MIIIYYILVVNCFYDKIKKTYETNSKRVRLTYQSSLKYCLDGVR